MTAPPPATSFPDVLVLGGGPGGSSAATFLARAGCRVLVLEKEHFPRFHVGESLLPYNRRLFAELGVLEKLEVAGFVRKHGAQFHLGNGTRATKFVFARGAFTREPDAWQVERARFDELLLRHAAEAGAEVREGWTAARFRTFPEAVEVDAESDSGERATFRAGFLVDATGRGNLTGNQEGLREIHPRLKKLAVFAHFRGVRLDAGPEGGDTVIVRLENKWFWLIPLGAEKTSVGCVLDRDEFAAAKEPPEAVFRRLVGSSPVMQERMAQAQAISPFQVTSDFSYRNRRLASPRLLRVGDAAGFMDPIFSAGVYLAMHSGKLAAETVHAALAAGDDGGPRLAAYERCVSRAMRFYWRMVEHYYTKPFMELFLQPARRGNLPAAVNAVLAGELEGGWAMRWRLRVFFWLVRLQGRFPLVPRLQVS